MKKFMVNSSSFEDFIEYGFAYVDKTDTIHQLINKNIGTQFFLARPRRFGKSLLLSTIKCIFEGKKELFRGLKIEKKWNYWDETYPVLHINMNECEADTIEEVKKLVLIMLEKEAKRHNVELSHAENLPACFYWLIDSLVSKSKNGKIVLLVDEYDKPILKHIGSEDVVPFQEFLRSFYTVIKDTNEFQRFTLITGVSKFSHVSIFSGLNNLVDLTMHPVAATLLGYTHQEMQDNFKENIQALADANNLTYDGTFQELIDHYDGYSFTDDLRKVFNPVSIANALSTLKLKNYWFKTANPSWLVPFMRKNPCFLEDEIKISDLELDTFDPVNLDMLPLLFQTGYLTIVDADNSMGQYIYTLDFPNNEVRQSFSTWLMSAYFSSDSRLNNSIQMEMWKSVNLGRPEKFIETLQRAFSTIPYNLHDKMKIEQAYQIILYVLCVSIGINITAEHVTNKGRIDILIQSPKFVYVIEMKLEQSAQSAIDQIKEKDYHQQFLSTDKKVYLIGLSFSSDEKNITEQIIEEISN